MRLHIKYTTTSIGPLGYNQKLATWHDVIIVWSIKGVSDYHWELFLKSHPWPPHGLLKITIITGILGPEGMKGNKGGRGPNGQNGSPGNPGQEGDSGETGEAGVPGNDGPAGNPGKYEILSTTRCFPVMYTFSNVIPPIYSLAFNQYYFYFRWRGTWGRERLIWKQRRYRSPRTNGRKRTTWFSWIGRLRFHVNSSQSTKHCPRMPWGNEQNVGRL